MDLYLQGDVGLSRFDEYISLWMNFEYNQKVPKKMRALRAYLGFTPEEYQRWVDDPTSLADILKQRKGEEDKEPQGWAGIPGQGYIYGEVA
jgi:hypothetical protein